MRLEGGVSGSRVRFGDPDEGSDDVERGSGGLFRARVEIPFAGSRKRQGRVISQAFQESSARKAVINYLSDYRMFAGRSLFMYQWSLYYRQMTRAYQRKLERLDVLLDDPRVKPEDLPRLRSTAGAGKVRVETSQASFQRSALSLLNYLGISPHESYVIEEMEPGPGPYLDRCRTPQGRRTLLELARRNNPTFRVLEDAIRDAELQRDLALAGTFDITAFVEGVQFPFGSETFDDRVGGWQIGAGVTVRLNDHRVLTATRRKAEARIRQFRAGIEAEERQIEQDVTTESDRLVTYHDARPKILANIEALEAELEERSKTYFAGTGNLTIDDVLIPLNGLTSAETQLASNDSYLVRAENALLSATGELYRMVGIRMNGDGTLAEAG